MKSLNTLKKTAAAAILSAAAASAQAATVSPETDVLGQIENPFGSIGNIFDTQAQNYTLGNDSAVKSWTPFGFRQELASPAGSTLAVMKAAEARPNGVLESCKLTGMKTGEARFVLTGDFESARAGGADAFAAMELAPQVNNETLRYQAQYITAHMFADNNEQQPFVRIQSGAPVNEQAFIRVGEQTFEATVVREDNQYTLYVNDNDTRKAIVDALTTGGDTVSVVATTQNGHAMQFDFKGSMDLSQPLTDCLADLNDGGFENMEPSEQIAWTIAEAPEMPETDRRAVVEAVAGSFCLRDENPADLYDLRIVQATTGFNVPTHLALYNKNTGETLVADYVKQKGSEFTLSYSMGQSLDHKIVSCAGKGVTVDTAKPLTPNTVSLTTLVPGIDVAIFTPGPGRVTITTPPSIFVPTGPETPAPVPGPASGILAISGLLALAAFRRRRQPGMDV